MPPSRWVHPTSGGTGQLGGAGFREHVNPVTEYSATTVVQRPAWGGFRILGATLDYRLLEGRPAFMVAGPIELDRKPSPKAKDHNLEGGHP